MSFVYFSKHNVYIYICCPHENAKTAHNMQVIKEQVSKVLLNVAK